MPLKRDGNLTTSPVLPAQVLRSSASLSNSKRGRQQQVTPVASAVSSALVVKLLLRSQVCCEYGMVHVLPEKGSSKGKDYCILFNSQWAHLPHDLGKAVSTRPGGAGRVQNCLCYGEASDS